jgi:shikimate dehydrogenase
MPDRLLFAVTGNPVLHSKSPQMFNSVFRENKIPATYFKIAADTAEEAIFIFQNLGLGGMNVTNPFKKDIMNHLDEVSEDARIIDGVNTVVREKGKLKGYNTDYIGVIRSLEAAHIPIKGRKCIVLGAGGAGRAAAYGLHKQGAEVTIVNRTYEKAVQAAQRIGCQADKPGTLEEQLKTADILISTISTGAEIVKEEWISSDLLLFDANYKTSPLYRIALKKGCKILKGEDWLLNQAIPGYKKFIGKEPDKKLMEKTLKGTIKQKTTLSMVGFMGSGKSSIGKQLAEDLHYDFIDTDQLIEEREGKTIPLIFSQEGEEHFRNLEKKIMQEVVQKRDTIISWGGGIIVDPLNIQYIKDHSMVVWLYATPCNCLKRIPPSTRPLLESENPIETANQLFKKRIGYYAQAADIVVSNESKTMTQVAGKIHEEIRNTFKN